MAENSNTAPANLIWNGEFSDERFIDMMAAHHTMAIGMAELVEEQASHAELKDFAKDMIETQSKEIEQLREVKKEHFASSGVPEKSHDNERSMRGMLDNDELKQASPFDKAFLDNNLPHHASAIVMASVAQKESRIDKLRSMARDIIQTQSEEIGKMIGWRTKWYGEKS